VIRCRFFIKLKSGEVVMRRNGHEPMRRDAVGGSELKTSKLTNGKAEQRSMTLAGDVVYSRCASIQDRPEPQAGEALGLLRCPQLRALVQLSRSTIWRLERVNQFPKRRQLSPRTVAWSAAEVRSWLKTRLQVGMPGGDDAE
jgi:predicted DNA-binding transcriptional regulator AlpA